MKIILILIFKSLVILTSLTSCNEQKKSGFGAKPKSRLVYTEVESIPLGDSILSAPYDKEYFLFFKEVEYIPLKQNPSFAPIGVTSKVLLYDNNIIALDVFVGKNVNVFKNNGDFLYTIDERNNIISPKDIVVKNKILYILDSYCYVFSFDLSTGKYLKKYELPFFSISLVAHDINSEDYIFDIYSISNKENKGFDYWLLNYDLSKRKVLYADFTKKEKEASPVNFFNINKLSTKSSASILSKPFNDTLFLINHKDIVPLVKFNFQKRSLSEQELFELGRNQRVGLEKIKKRDLFIGYRFPLVAGNILSVGYQIGRKRNLIYYDLDKKKLIVMTKFIDKKFYGAFDPRPIGVFENKMIYAIDVRAMRNYINFLMKENKSFKVSQEAENIIKLSNGSNNPVIVLAKPSI